MLACSATSSGVLSHEGTVEDEATPSDGGPSARTRPTPSGTTAFAARPRPSATTGPETTASDDPAALARVVACDEPKVQLVAPPPSDGVVFNNAQTDPDADYIDRLRRLVARVRDDVGFRCCLDDWLRDEELAAPALSMNIVIEPDGAAGAVRVVLTESPTTSTELTSTPRRRRLEACFAHAARRMPFPPSPTGKPTMLDYPFEVRPPTHDAPTAQARRPGVSEGPNPAGADPQDEERTETTRDPYTRDHNR